MYSNYRKITKKNSYNLIVKYIYILIFLVLLLILFRKYFSIILIMSLSVMIMLHKKYLDINLGIDVCLILTMLSSSKFGFILGIIIGVGSFLIGMILTLQITRTPMITIYASLFYLMLSLVYSFVPIGIIYKYSLLHILLVSIPFTIGASLVGAPIKFLIRYVPTNIIANLIFIQIFGFLLKMVF